jgi:hypothetical protein
MDVLVTQLAGDFPEQLVMHFARDFLEKMKFLYVAAVPQKQLVILYLSDSWVLAIFLDASELVLVMHFADWVLAIHLVVVISPPQLQLQVSSQRCR